MSTGAQVAILDGRGVRSGHVRRVVAEASAPRPLLRLVAFAALGLYGALRWATMLSPAPDARMLGLLAVAVLLAAAGPSLTRRRPGLMAVLAAAGALAVLAVAGIPVSWLRHVRIAVTIDSIGEGLNALPQAFVPYDGINESVRIVIVLGGGALLWLAALPLAFARGPVGQLRRAAAALPLLILTMVPATLVRPQLAYLQGLIVFALLAAFAWGERVPRRSGPLVAASLALAGAAAMLAAPALDAHRPWLDYEALAGTLSPRHVDAFDWSQRYGPLNWPRSGREVLDVAAARPDYWKTESLELFRGTGWELGSTDYGEEPPPPSPASVTRWSQTIQVTLRAMRSQPVIGAGFSAAPVHLTQPITPGVAAGTWSAAGELQPGDSYRITTYSPRPTQAELEHAPETYPAAALQGDLTIVLLQPGLPDQQIVFAPFGSGQPPLDVANYTGVSGAAAVEASPYAGVYALARRLASQAHTPAGYVAAVLAHLGHGYTYNENPPPSRYPLVSFLLRDRTGYCQQFAGAMALLLRMGGVPARVATGFTTGQYDHDRHQYVVSDLDAHAWVEAWFPRYGWVRFDPTPRSAPARSGSAAPPVLPSNYGLVRPQRPVRRADPAAAPSPGRPTTGVSGGGPATGVLLGGGLLLALVAIVLLLTLRVREPSERTLLAELERAMARCGRPPPGGLTLAGLERRFRDSPEAAAYVRAIRLMRFAGNAAAPTLAQRRALRRQLRADLGLSGRLRALWALPPRWSPGLRREPSQRA